MNLNKLRPAWYRFQMESQIAPLAPHDILNLINVDLAKAKNEASKMKLLSYSLLFFLLLMMS